MSESARLLRSLGVRTDVAAKFSDRPVEQIKDVIAQARARQDVRNIAAWVVSVLRTLPATEEIAPVTDGPSSLPILLHEDISGYDRMRWMELFRSTPPADRQAVLDRFRVQHPYDQEPRNPYADLDPAGRCAAACGADR